MQNKVWLSEGSFKPTDKRYVAHAQHGMNPTAVTHSCRLKMLETEGTHYIIPFMWGSRMGQAKECSESEIPSGCLLREAWMTLLGHWNSSNHKQTYFKSLWTNRFMMSVGQHHGAACWATARNAGIPCQGVVEPVVLLSVQLPVNVPGKVWKEAQVADALLQPMRETWLLPCLAFATYLGSELAVDYLPMSPLSVLSN